jgi:hypothetical protein
MDETEVRAVNRAWYQVLSLSFGYVSCAIAVICVLCALRRFLRDRRILRHVRKSTPNVGYAGVLRVLSAGLRRIPAGTQIRVPYEGTVGAARSCDVCIPYRKVHLRSAFFWMESDGLHMVALHRDGFVVDDVPVEPGDEAILDDGAVLMIGEVKLVWHMKDGRPASFEAVTGPYVTSQRKSRARQGKGDGLGAPGKAELRREKKLDKKKTKNAEKEAAKRSVKKTDQKEEKKTGRRREVDTCPANSKSTPRRSSGTATARPTRRSKE